MSTPPATPPLPPRTIPDLLRDIGAFVEEHWEGSEGRAAVVGRSLDEIAEHLDAHLKLVKEAREMLVGVMQSSTLVVDG